MYFTEKKLAGIRFCCMVILFQVFHYYLVEEYWARLQNTPPLTVGLKILLPQSRSHQINIKTEYKQHEISMYLSFFKHCSLNFSSTTTLRQQQFNKLRIYFSSTTALRQQQFNLLRIYFSSRTTALRHCGGNSLTYLDFRLRHCGTAVAVLQHTRSSLFNNHCGTAGARNFCRSKWAGYSAIAPHVSLYQTSTTNKYRRCTRSAVNG